jgi:RHS repeat-associated protein
MVLTVKLNPEVGASQGRPQSAIASYVWRPDLGSQPFARRNWQAAGGVRGLVMASYFTGANGGGIHLPVMDAMGNVTQVVRAGVQLNYNGDSMRSEFVYDYDAFGKETRSSTLVAGLNPDSFPFHYSTKFTDPESGFNYYGYRFYDPANGRWPSRDPIGEEGGENLYGFVENDPVNLFDVFGFQPAGGGRPPRVGPVANAQAMQQANLGQSMLRRTIQEAINRIGKGSCCSPAEQANAIRELNNVIGPTIGPPSTVASVMAQTAQMRAAFEAAMRRLAQCEITAMTRPAGLPPEWISRPTDGAGGTQWYNPNNPNQTVRVMPGDPSSPYPNSQRPYVRQTDSSGTFLRQDGTRSPLPNRGNFDGDAHIPVQNFIFRP